MIRYLYKIIMILCIAILFFNMTANTIYARVQINNDLAKRYLEKIGQAEYHLKYYNLDKKEYDYIICPIVGTDTKGGFNPAYCMNSDLDGAEKEPYYVTIENALDNDKVWRVIKNGYPYKNAEALGLESNYDAYVVTKMAVYCMLGQSKLENFKAEEDDREAVAMLNVLKQLVDIGNNGTEKQELNPLIITKIGELKDEGKYVSQEYSVTAKVASEEYHIMRSSNLVEGSFIANTEGTQNDYFKMGEHFKVMIPKEKLNEDIQITIELQAKCQVYVIFEGKTTVENTQNYVVTAGDKRYFKEKIELNIEAPKYGNLKIIKVDKENEAIKLEGTKFELFNEQNKKIGEYKTNSNGEIYIENLPVGKYTLKEIETNNNYVLNNEKIEVQIEENKTKDITIENEKIKGKIKIIKTSESDSKMNGKKAGDPIEGTKFQIYNNENKLVETITTNKDGIAISSDLEKGNYKVKEAETSKYYFLNKNTYDANIEENKQTVLLEIKNEPKNPGIDVEKSGSEKANIGENVEYDISFRNTGNTPLDNVTLIDYIPSEYVDVGRIKTGTYNQKVLYNLYYKTNLSDDYVLFMEDLKSNENYDIDLKEELAKNEYITHLKMKFETIDVGFATNENPHITGTVKNTVKSGEVFTNNVEISGSFEGFRVNDKSKWKTVGYKLLPQTGF